VEGALSICHFGKKCNDDFSLHGPGRAIFQNVYEQKDDLIIKAEMPGLTKDEIDIVKVKVALT
jgi:HSP20 family molecular chaperone IbpA